MDLAIDRRRLDHQQPGQATDAHVGDALSFDLSGTQISITVGGIVPIVPATTQLAQLTGAGMTGAQNGAAPAVVVDYTALQRALVEAGAPEPFIDEWWVDVPSGEAAAYLASHSTSAAGSRSSELLAAELEAGPLRIATQAALWLAVIAAALLASIGFAVHTAAACGLDASSSPSCGRSACRVGLLPG